MRQNYNGDRPAQSRRRHSLMAVRSTLGDERFADFLVDLLSGQGSDLNFDDLGPLVPIWLSRRSGNGSPGCRPTSPRTPAPEAREIEISPVAPPRPYHRRAEPRGTGRWAQKRRLAGATA
jgi:hypothetical protein